MTSFISLARHGGETLFAFQNLSYFQLRGISMSSVLHGKRNMRKFFLGNKRGTKLFKKDLNAGKYDKWATVYTEVQDTGFYYDKQHHRVPEMIPDIIVPDLTDFQLKPYVSYRTAEIYQSEFTAQDLFDIVYKHKITTDFNEKKLNEEGTPLEPNEAEKMTPDEAWTAARQTGSDLFSERIPRQWECLEKSLIDEPSPQIQVSSFDEEMIHPSEVHKQLPVSIPSPNPSAIQNPPEAPPRPQRSSFLPPKKVRKR